MSDYQTRQPFRPANFLQFTKALFSRSQQVCDVVPVDGNHVDVLLITYKEATTPICGDTARIKIVPVDTFEGPDQLLCARVVSLYATSAASRHQKRHTFHLSTAHIKNCSPKWKWICIRKSVHRAAVQLMYCRFSSKYFVPQGSVRCTHHRWTAWFDGMSQNNFLEILCITEFYDRSMAIPTG